MLFLLHPGEPGSSIHTYKENLKFWIILGGMNMYQLNKLKIMAQSAPTKYVFILGLILGILGIIAHYIKIPFVTDYNYIFLVIGFAFLALGTMFKGI